jgi:hypothetical protein
MACPKQLPWGCCASAAAVKAAALAVPWLLGVQCHSRELGVVQAACRARREVVTEDGCVKGVAMSRRQQQRPGANDDGGFGGVGVVQVLRVVLLVPNMLLDQLLLLLLRHACECAC